MDEKKKWIKAFFKNGWTKGIGISIISYFLISLITTIVKKVDFLQGMKAVGNWIYGFLTIDVKMWVILVAAAVAVSMILLIRRTKVLPHRKYRKEQIKEWVFVWDYSPDGKLLNIQPVCKICGCNLTETNSFGYISPLPARVYCPDCGEEYPARIPYEDIKKVIENKINTRSYKMSPYFKNREETLPRRGA